MLRIQFFRSELHFSREITSFIALDNSLKAHNIINSPAFESFQTTFADILSSRMEENSTAGDAKCIRAENFLGSWNILSWLPEENAW